MSVSFPISFILQAWGAAPRQGVACQAYMLVSPLTDGLCNRARWTTLETWFIGKVNSVIHADSQQEPQVYWGIVQLCYSLQNTKASLARRLSRSNTVSPLKLAVQSLPSHPRNMLLPPVFHHHGHLIDPQGEPYTYSRIFTGFIFSRSRPLNWVPMGAGACAKEPGQPCSWEQDGRKGMRPPLSVAASN